MVGLEYYWVNHFKCFEHMVFVFEFLIKKTKKNKETGLVAENPFNGNSLIEYPIILEAYFFTSW